MTYYPSLAQEALGEFQQDAAILDYVKDHEAATIDDLELALRMHQEGWVTRGMLQATHDAIDNALRQIHRLCHPAITASSQEPENSHPMPDADGDLGGGFTDLDSREKGDTPDDDVEKASEDVNDESEMGDGYPDGEGAELDKSEAELLLGLQHEVDKVMLAPAATHTTVRKCIYVKHILTDMMPVPNVLIGESSPHKPRPKAKAKAKLATPKPRQKLRLRE